MAKMRVHSLRIAAEVAAPPAGAVKMRVHSLRMVGAVGMSLVSQPDSIAEPGEEFTITVETVEGTAKPETYVWRVVSGPTAAIIGNGPQARLIVPAAFATKTLVVGVRGKIGSTLSAEVFTTLTIPPQPSWIKGPGQATWQPTRGLAPRPVVETPDTLPTRLPAGLVARSYEMAQGGLHEIFSGMVASDWSWARLQPNGPDTLSASVMTEIIAAFDWAWEQRGVDGKPYDVVWRMDAGYNSPLWLKNEVGTYVAYGRDGGPYGDPAPSDPAFTMLPGGVPKNWTRKYLDYKANVNRLLARPVNRANPAAGGIVGLPALVGWTNTDPSTQFNEPTVKQYACRENRENAAAAGWTPELDFKAFEAQWSSLKAALAGTGIFVESAYNKAETITSSGRYFADPDRAIAIMETQRLALGPFCMWSNHGLAGGDDTKVFAWMRSGRAGNKVPISFQTRTKGKLDDDFARGQTLSTVEATIQQAADWGASWVEPPTRATAAPNPLTMEFVRSIQATFRANNVGLDMGTPPVQPGVALHPVIGWADDNPYADGAQANGGNPKSMVRLPPMWAINNGGFRHVFLNVGIGEITNTTAGGVVTYKAGSLEERLAPVITWNAANPTKKIYVSIRLHVGIRAAEVWRTICGEVVINNETFNSGGPIPIWWNAAYKNLYKQAMSVVGAVVDTIDCVGSINNPMHAMSYPEPFLLYAGQANGNKEALAAAGWTNAKHKAWMRWAVSKDATGGVTKKIVYQNVNPASWPTDDGTGTGPTEIAFLKEILGLHIAARPAGLAGASNYSYATDRVLDPGTYRTMYEHLDTIAPTCWVEVQLARPQRINGDAATVKVFDSLAQNAFDRGYHGVETSGFNPDETFANVWDRSYEPSAALLKSQNAAAKLIPGPAATL